MNHLKSSFSRRSVIKGLVAYCIMLFSSCNTAEAKGKSLVTYFSWGGNTRKVAELVAKETGAALLEIKTAKPYPSGYAEGGAVAKKEWEENSMPKLSTAVSADFADYKVIYIGYPVWNHTMPMPVYAFLESHDFSGKIIVPFSTHMGDGLADGPEQIARLCPNAEVLPGLAIRSNDIGHCQSEIRKWLQSNRLL